MFYNFLMASVSVKITSISILWYSYHECSESLFSILLKDSWLWECLIPGEVCFIMMVICVRQDLVSPWSHNTTNQCGNTMTPDHTGNNLQGNPKGRGHQLITHCYVMPLLCCCKRLDGHIVARIFSLCIAAIVNI